MRGRTVRTPELVAEATRLRAEGLTYKQIGEVLGVSLQAAREWITDPDSAQRTARKVGYQGVCDSCGGPTDGTMGPGRASKRCMECIEWPAEAVVAAMQRWADDHGGLPPRMEDWREAAPDRPCATVVAVGKIGWNELLLRAGFGLRLDRRAETQREIERLVRAYVPPREIAEEFGVTTSAVYMRFRTRGTTLTAFRDAA